MCMYQDNLGEYHPLEEETPEEQSEEEKQLHTAAIIENTGSIQPSNAKHLIHCLTVIGQVEGHYELSSQKCLR